MNQNERWRRAAGRLAMLTAAAMLLLALCPISALAADELIPAPDDPHTENSQTGAKLDSVKPDAPLSEGPAQPEAESVQGNHQPKSQTKSSDKPQNDLIISTMSLEPGGTGTDDPPTEEENGENAEDGEQEEPVPEPDYQTPEGTAYVAGDESTVYTNNGQTNAIQQAVDAAVTAGKKSITVVVQDGVYTGGLYLKAAEETTLNILAEDSYDLKEGGDLLKKNGEEKDLNLVTKDAEGNEEGDVTLHSNASGLVQLEGPVDVENVNLTMAGLYFSLRSQQEQKQVIEKAQEPEGKEPEQKGAGQPDTPDEPQTPEEEKKEPQTETVYVEGHGNEVRVQGSLTYYGTVMDDNVTFDVSGNGGDILIDGGEGNDSFDVTVRQEPTVSSEKALNLDPENLKEGVVNDLADAISGSGKDKLSQANVTITTGSGDDTVDLKLVNTTQIGMEEKLVVAADLSTSQVTIDTGDGADEISVCGGMDLNLLEGKIFGKALEGIQEGIIKGSESGKAPTSTVEILCGSGDDSVAIDSTLAFSSLFDVTTTVRGDGEQADGKPQFDHVNLSGRIGENLSYEADTGLVKAESLGELKVLSAVVATVKAPFSVTIADVEAITDTLEGKKTVKKTAAELCKEQFESFTDYVVIDYQPDQILENVSGAGTYFSNLILEGEQLEVGDIHAPNMTVILSSENTGLNQAGSIRIRGRVTGRNILLETVNSDSHGLKVIENNLDDEDAGQIEGSLFDIASNCEIILEETGALLATHMVNLSAVSTQSQGLVPSLEELDKLVPGVSAGLNLNFVAVKVGSAVIDVLGRIFSGAFKATAKSIIDTAAANNALRTLGLPLAVGVAVSKAVIQVTGQIGTDQGGSTMKTDSQVLLNTEAVSGTLPFSIAVGVAVNDSHVEVTDQAAVEAAGDIHLDARGYTAAHTRSGSLSEVPPENGEKPKSGSSGGFFAVTAVTQDVSAEIEKNASVAAGADLQVRSTADSHVKTHAVTSPKETGNSGTLDQSLRQIENFLNQTVNQSQGTEGGGSSQGITALSSFADKISGKDGSGEGAADLVNTGTESASGSSTTPTSTSQMVGALAVTYAGSQNRAHIHTGGVLRAGEALQLQANGFMKQQTLADGTPVNNDPKNGKPSKTSSLGAALAVAVVNHENSAALLGGSSGDLQKKEDSLVGTSSRDGAVHAGSLEVSTSTLEESSQAIAKAGFTASNLGIAGAISVHVASSLHDALVGGSDSMLQKLVLSDGSDILLNSQVGRAVYTTVADAAGEAAAAIPTTPAPGNKATAKKTTGVGAGLAIAVIGADVQSRLSDSVSISAGTLGGMDVNASFDGSENMVSRAGASGGTAIVPVLALDISGIYVLAEAGNRADPVLPFEKDISVQADSAILRTITSDAAAAGTGVGMGSSMIVSVLNDGAHANLGRSLKTKGKVSVKSSSVSRASGTANASAGGARETSDKKSPDTSSGGDDPGSSDGPGPDGDQSQNQQMDDLFGGNGKPASKKETDGMRKAFTKGEADAMADANLESGAKLADRAGTRNTNGDSVRNQTANRQQAETSEGSLQIAAAFVVNVQNNSSVASLACEIVEKEDPRYTEENLGRLPVAGISISAEKEMEIISLQDTDGVILANGSSVNSTQGVGAAAAVNTVSYENVAYVGADHLAGSSLHVEAQILEAENKSFRDQVLRALLEDLMNSLAPTALLEGLLNAVIAAREAGPEENPADKKDSALTDQIQEVLKEKISGFSKLIGDDAGQAKLVIALFKSYCIDQMASAMLDGEPAELTELKDGEGNVIYESFSKDVKKMLDDGDLTTVLKEFGLYLADSLLDPNVIKTVLQQPELFTDVIRQVGENCANRENGRQLIRTVFATLAFMMGGNEEIGNCGSRISASAVSGVGASDVGVAGSVAINVVNALTQAVIADADGGKLNFSSGDIRILSDGTQVVYTTAGASVDKEGRPDKNKAATGNATASGSDPNAQPKGGTKTSVGVGAAVTTSVSNLTVHAGIGEGWEVLAKTLEIRALANNDLDTNSVAGTDPLARSEETEGKADENLSYSTAADASVAVNVISNDVQAYAGRNTDVTLTGGKNGIEIHKQDAFSRTGSGKDAFDLYIFAGQTGDTNTSASGMAMGESTSVGAAVAVNVASSQVGASFHGNGTVEGNARIAAATVNYDATNALALAMGADMERYLSKIRAAQSTIQKDPNAGNETSKKVSGAMDESSSNQKPRKEGTEDASPDGVTDKPGEVNAVLPASVNAIHSQGVKTADSTADQANISKDLKGVTGNNTEAHGGDANQSIDHALNGNNTAAKGQSTSQTIHVAAAVAVATTDHKSNTVVDGNLQANTISADAVNRANFATTGSGAAVTQAANSNAIGAAVAVTVNANEANVTLGGKLQATGEDDGIQAHADLTANLDYEFGGRYNAMAIAGAASGTGGKATIAGAVAVAVTNAMASLTVLDGAQLLAEKAPIVLLAADQSKSNAAAMAVVLSKGSVAGVGATFALLHAENLVDVEIGQQVTVVARSLKVMAEKKNVSIRDYNPPFKMSDIVTMSDPSGAPFKGKKGVFHVAKNSEEDSYELEAGSNLDMGTIVNLAELTGTMGNINYFLFSAAGSIGSGPLPGKAAVAGSVSTMVNTSQTLANVGSNFNLTVLDGDFDLRAKSDNDVRLISGSLTVSPAVAGVGATVAVLIHKDQTRASLADRTDGTSQIQVSGGSVNIVADSDLDLTAVTIAAAASSGMGSKASVGGGVTVIVTENKVGAEIGDNVRITIHQTGKPGDLNLQALNDGTLVLVNTSLGAAAHTAAAVGGTVAVISAGSEAIARAGSNAVLINHAGAMDILAHNEQLLVNVLASVSGAGSAVAAVAGTVGVLITKDKALAQVGSGAKLTAQKNLQIRAEGDSELVSVLASLVGTGGGTAAVGAVILVSVFNRENIARVEKLAQLVSEGGSVIVSAQGDELTVLVSVAGAFSGAPNAVSGNIQVNVGTSTVRAELSQQVTVNAYDSVGILADHHNVVTPIAASISASSGVGIGATTVTTVLSNITEALVGNSCRITASALNDQLDAGIRTRNRENRRKGILVHAFADETIVMVGVAGGAAAGAAGVGGVVDTLVVTNVTKALVGSSVMLMAGREPETSSEPADGEDVTVEAEDDSFLMNFGGAVGASATAGVGATVVVLTFGKTTVAAIDHIPVKTENPSAPESAGKNQTNVKARDSITVKAEALDDVYLLGVALGAAGTAGVAGDVNVLVFHNETTAKLNGQANAELGDLTVEALQDSQLVNVSAGLGAGGTAGVTAVAVVTYFESKTLAYLESGSSATAGGNITVHAGSQELVTADACGLSGGGAAGVGGTVDVIVTQVVTKAYTGASVSVTAGGDFTVRADDSYGLIGIVVTIAGSGMAAVGVTALVSVSYNTILAEIGQNNLVSAHSVTVTADSLRDVIDAGGTVAGGTVGSGTTILVVLLGNKMSQDAHDSLYNDGKTMDPQTQLDAAFAKGDPRAAKLKPATSLDTLLEGDGQKVGTEDYSQFETDTASKPIAGDGQLYIYDGTEKIYRPVTEEEANGVYKNRDCFLFNPQTNAYEKLTGERTVNQFDTSAYDKISAGQGTTFQGAQPELPGNGKEASFRKDSVAAHIASGSIVTAEADLTVEAHDVVNVNVVSGTVGAGGSGVGVGISVVILHSNVQAQADRNAVLSAGGTVTVSAESGSVAEEKQNLKNDHLDVNKTLTSDKIEMPAMDKKSTIRLISVTVGGGMVGVGVSAAVLLVFSDVDAILEANVSSAQNVVVSASMGYGDVLTVNTGLAAGAIAVNVSAAVTYFGGSAVAAIREDAEIHASDLVSVYTHAVTNASAAAGTLGGGASATNAGVVLAINRTELRSTIGSLVTIRGVGTESASAAAGPAVSVSHRFTSNADGYILSITAGGTAVGASVVIVINDLDARSTVGLAGNKSSQETRKPGTIQASSLTVKADGNANATANGAAVAGGMAAYNGIVALAFSRSSNIAEVKRANVTGGDVTLIAVLEGNASTFTTSVTAGLVAGGATIAVSDISSINQTLVDSTEAVLNVKSLKLNAGLQDRPNDSHAFTTAITGVAGKTAVGINVGLALNRGSNLAQVMGTGSIIADGAIHVEAYGYGRAYAVIGSAALGEVAVNGSMAFAWIRNIQKASLEAGGTITAGSMTVNSVQKPPKHEQIDHVLHFGTTNEKHNENVAVLTFDSMAQAYILSAGAGVLSVTINSATALADASSIAKIRAEDLRTAAGITVTNDAESTAHANITNLSFGAVTVGVMAGVTLASGTFEAVLESGSNILAGGDILVSNNYFAEGKNRTDPALGGVKMAGVDAQVNVGVSIVDTRSLAKLGGSGILTAKNLSLINSGKVTSHSEVVGGKFAGSIVSVLGNVVISRLHALQRVQVEDVRIEARAADTPKPMNVTILNLYNVSDKKASYDTDGNLMVPARIGTTGAFALIGTNMVTVSAVGLGANVAMADSNSRVLTEVRNAGADISGSLTAHTLASSYAKADVARPVVSVSLAKVNVATLFSDASGIYETRISGSSRICAGSIQVGTAHDSVSKAMTGPQGGTGVSINGINADFNLADADLTTNATAVITAFGGITTTAGDLSVQVSGKNIAEATIYQDAVTISLVDLAGTLTEANVASRQYAGLDSSGTVKVAGNLLIYSRAADGKADAFSGTPNNGGVKLSLISSTGLQAKAASRMNSRAILNASREITASGDITVLSDITNQALAKVRQPVSISIGGILMTLAQTAVHDSSDASLGGQKVRADGSISVRAISNSISHANGIVGTSVKLISMDGGTTEATVGSSGNPNCVSAVIADDAVVTANGDILVEALNRSSALAKMHNGVKVSLLAGIEFQQVPTSTTLKTDALIGSRSHVTSLHGQILVNADDTGSADSRVDGESIGFAVSASIKYAENKMSQNTSAGVGRNSNLWAGNGIQICADSNATMTALTDAVNAGMFSEGTLKAFNVISRTVNTTIGDNTELFTDFGNISVLSRSGLSDSIFTQATGSSSGLIAIGDVSAKTIYATSSTVTLGGGVTITNTFGNADVAAYVSAGSVKTVGDIGTGAFGGDSNARSDFYHNMDTSSSLNAKVYVADNAAAQTRITAKNVKILAKLDQLYLHTYTDATTKGFLNFAHAYSDIRFDMDVAVTVGNAHISAYDVLSVVADANPENQGVNLFMRADTKIVAFAGRVESYARLKGLTQANVTVGALARITGADVHVERNLFHGNVVTKAVGTRRAIASEKEETKNTLAITGETKIDQNVKFDIGDAAAGIAIDFYEDTQPRFRSVGTPASFRISFMGNDIRIENIVNILPGKLSIMGSSRGLGDDALANILYGQRYIPTLVVTNRTDKNLVFRNVDLSNETFTRAAVNSIDSSNVNCYSAAHLHESEDTTPEIYIYNWGIGNVTFTGIVNNEHGLVHIEWTEDLSQVHTDRTDYASLYTTDPLIGNLHTAPLWTHRLEVINARNVGVDGEHRFSVYLTPHQGQNASIRMDAKGSVFAKLTLADILPVTQLSQIPDTSAIPGTLELQNIRAAGAADVILPTAIRLEYLADLRTAGIVIPGIIEFTTETVWMDQQTVSLDEIAGYRIGSENDVLEIYHLPNGMTIYVEKSGAQKGRVRRMVTEDNAVFDTTLYRLYDNAVIELLEYGGTKLDLVTGVLTAGEDGFDLQLLHDINHGWYTVEGDVESVDKAAYLYYENDAWNEMDIDTIKNSGRIFSVGTNGSGDAVYFYLLTDGDLKNLQDQDTGNAVYLVGLDQFDYFYGVHQMKYETGKSYQTEVVSGMQEDIPVSTDPVYKNGKLVSKETVTSNKTNYKVKALNGRFYMIYTVEVITTVYEEFDENGKVTKSESNQETREHFSDLQINSAVSGYLGYVNGKFSYEGELGAKRFQFTCDRPYMQACESTSFDVSTGGDESVTVVGYDFNAGNGNHFQVVPDTVYLLRDLNGYRHTSESGQPNLGEPYALQSIEYSYKTHSADIRQPNGGIYSFLYSFFNLKRGAVLHLDANESVTLRAYPPRSGAGLIYYLTKNLQIQTDGVVISRVPDRTEEGLIGEEIPNTTFIYDPVSGTIRAERRIKNPDDEVVLSYMAEIGEGKLTMNGQQHLARLSRNVAKDLFGQYYCLSGSSSWTPALTETIDGVTYIRNLDFPHLITLMAIYVGTGTEEGNRKGVTYYVEYENSASGGNPEKPLVRVGSDGSVFWFEMPENSIGISNVPGTKYLVKHLQGSGVRLDMVDHMGSLLDGDSYADEANQEKKPDIIADSGDIVILAASRGSVGTPENPLDLIVKSPNGRIHILERGGLTHVAADTYLYIPNGNVNLDPSLVVDPNVKFTLMTGDGSILGYDLTVSPGATAILRTNKLEVYEGGKLTGYADNPGAVSPGHITFHNILTGGKGKPVAGLEFDAAGDITIVEDLSWYEANGVPNEVTPIGLESFNSIIILLSGGEITIRNGLAATGSMVTAESRSHFTADYLGVAGSGLYLTAGEDLLFKSLIAKDTIVSLEAGRNIGMLDNGILCGEYGWRSFIKFADTDTDTESLKLLTLRAGGDMGTEAAPLILDIPETVTVQVAGVRNLSLDNLVLILGNTAGADTVYVPVGNSPILAVDVVTHPDNPMVDEFLGWGKEDLDTELDGDWLKFIEKQLVATDLGIETPEQLAEWIMKRAERNSWTGEFTQAVLMSLLGEQKGITPELIAETLGNEGILALLDEEKRASYNPDRAVETVVLLLNEHRDKVFGALLNGLNTLDPGEAPDDREAHPAGFTYRMPYETAHNLFAGILAVQLNGTAEIIPDLEKYVESLLTDQDLRELCRRAMELSVEPQVTHKDTDPRDFNLHILKADGTLDLYNDGTIRVDLEDGNMNLKHIKSQREDVFLTARNGSILPDGQGEHIFGRQVNLTASGSIGTEADPLILEQQGNSPKRVVHVDQEQFFAPDTGDRVLPLYRDAQGRWMLNILVQYDWIREDYQAMSPDTTPALHVDAGADAGIRELTGSGRGSMKVGGNAVYWVPDQLGTYEDPMITDVGGLLTIHANRAIHILDLGNLNLAADSAEDEVTAAAKGDIDLQNLNGGDMIVGPIRSESGDLRVTTPTGSIRQGQSHGENAYLQGGSMELEAPGDIGAENNLLTVDTGNGTLKASGRNIYLEEISGDLKLSNLTAAGNAVIIAAGSILDTNSGSALQDAADLQQDALDAMNRADASTAKAGALRQFADEKQAAADEEHRKLQELQKQIADLTARIAGIEGVRSDPTLTEQEKNQLIEQLLAEDESLEQMQQKKEQLELQEPVQKNKYDQAQVEADNAEKLAQSAENLAASQRSDAEKAQIKADAALQTALGSKPTVSTVGALTMDAGKDIGSEKDPLDLSVGGSFNGTAAGDLRITNLGNLELGQLTSGGNAGITASGDIGQPQGSAPIRADGLELNTLNGNADVRTEADEISGAISGNAALENTGNLSVNDLNVGGNLDLTVNGGITAGTAADGSANLTVGGNLTTETTGSIGAAEKPLAVDIQGGVTASSKDVYLHSLNDLTIDRIGGNKIQIQSEGRIQTGVSPDNINLDGSNVSLEANGDIGQPDRYLQVQVTDTANAQSQYGHIYWNVTYIRDGVSYLPRELTDPETGIHLTGLFAACAALEVQVIDRVLAEQLLQEMELVRSWMAGGTEVPALRTDHWDVMWPCENCRSLLEQILRDETIFACRLDVYCTRIPLEARLYGSQNFEPFQQQLHGLQGVFPSRAHAAAISPIELRVSLYDLLEGYDGSYEGMTLSAVICIGGELQRFSCTVTDGMIQFTLDSLGDGHFLLILQTEKL